MSKPILYNPECSSCIENMAELKSYYIKYYKLVDFVKDVSKAKWMQAVEIRLARELLKEISENE